MAKKQKRGVPSGAANAVQTLPVGTIPVKAITARVLGLADRERGIHINLKYYQSDYDLIMVYK